MNAGLAGASAVGYSSIGLREGTVSSPLPSDSAVRTDAERDLRPRSSSVRAQLSRILRSRTFLNATALGKLLHHIVEETLQGRASELKEYALGVDVFNRGSDFDPRADTIVRVQARRLRAKLDAYYRAEHDGDPYREETTTA